MKANVVGLLFGAGIAFVLAWARLTDPEVIRRMLLLKELDVFLLMGSAVMVAAVGVRVLRSLGMRALVTGERVDWSEERPQARHFVGSILFGAGWSVAATCPGPVTAMIGEGRLAGFVVVGGIAGGVVLQAALARQRPATAAQREVPGAAGL